MAYRRKQAGMQRSATFVEDHRQHHHQPGDTSSPAIASPRATRFADDSRRPDRSLAAQAMLASAASSPHPDASTMDPVTQMYTSTRGGANNDPKHGFWGVLAQQAKEMLDETGGTDDGRDHHSLTSQSRWSYDRVRNPENPVLDIGGKIKNVLEEGPTKAEGGSRKGSTGDVIHGSRKLQIRRKTCSMDFRNTSLSLASPDMSPMLSDTESPQIKASRDVASAMVAKVKLLQRELKTVKADMAFSRERCAQLEEENRLLRGDGSHGASDADDEDLIRQQLETLLAEKARLANDNTVYARENRFLREIVEFHQLNMQDVVEVNLDDGEDDDMIDDDEEEDDEQYGRRLPGTAPQSPLGRHAGGRMRVMSRSNSGAGESHLRRRFLGVPETPPTRRSLKEEDIDNEPLTPPTRRSLKDEGVDEPETPPTHRRLKEEDVLEPETPPTRRSLEEDVDEPETPPTRWSLKEEDVLEPKTPPTRRSLKEDVLEPETPPTRRSLKEENVEEPETPPTRRSIKEDVDDAPETSPTRRSFKEDIGSPEKAATPTRRSFKEDIGSPEKAATPTRQSFKEEIGSPETAATPTRERFKEGIGLPETAATPTRRSCSEDLVAAETTTTPTRQSFKDESGKTEMTNED